MFLFKKMTSKTFKELYFTFKNFNFFDKELKKQYNYLKQLYFFLP